MTFDWKYLENPRNPADGPVVEILECDDKIVGMHGRMFVLFKINEDTISATWGGDTHVVPDHRKASGWFAYQVNKIASVVEFGMPNQENYAIQSAANALIEVARFTDFKTWLDLGPVFKAKGFNPLLSSICGLVFSLAPRAFGLFSKFRAENGVSVQEVSRFDSRLDDLWQTVSEDYAGIMVRDQSFLSWRFDQCPNRDYTRYIAERDGKIVGYMVTREFRWSGVGHGRIVDYLVRRNDASALNALLQSAIQGFRSRGVVAVSCSVFTTDRKQIQQFRLHGFLYRRPGPRILVDRGSWQETFATIENWFFTYADGDIDYCEFEDEEGEANL